MAVKRIGQFPGGTPTASDKILFEQDGNGKSASIEDIGKAIGKAIGIDANLLWTNARPTSSFSPQVISLDLSEYKYILISFYFDTVNTNLSHLYLFDKGDKQRAVSSVNDQYGTARKIMRITDSSIAIGVGVLTSYPGSSGATYDENNAQMIPYQIYGVK